MTATNYNNNPQRQRTTLSYACSQPLFPLPNVSVSFFFGAIAELARGLVGQ